MVRKVMGNIYNWWKNEKKASKILMIFAAFLIVFSVIIGRVSNVSFAADIPDRMTSSIQSFEDGYPAFGLFDGITLGSVFVASDALAHYILMMYEIAHYEEFAQELNIAESYCTKNSNYIRAAKNIHSIHFERDILGKLLNCVGHSTNFHRHLNALIRKGLIAHDDYSLAVLENT